jgi:hypothetical protein
MIEHTLDTVNSVLYVRPKSSLAQSDFAALARTIGYIHIGRVEPKWVCSLNMPSKVGATTSFFNGSFT